MKADSERSSDHDLETIAGSIRLPTGSHCRDIAGKISAIREPWTMNEKPRRRFRKPASPWIVISPLADIT
jgi:hypothetical protein